MTNSGAALKASMSYDIGGIAAVDAAASSRRARGWWCTRDRTLVPAESLGWVSSTALVSNYKVSSGTSNTFEKRWMSVTPVRVS
jgi:hypothetical protein